MKHLFGCVMFAVLLVLILPELACYRAELVLSEANGRLSEALRGTTTGDSAIRSVELALTEARSVSDLLPGDPRPPLAEAVALLLLHRGSEAVAVLDRAVAKGERPELIINLGRARGVSGDEIGAQRAFLRTAWGSPASIATLPSALRGPLLEQIAALEIELRAGRLTAPPPL